ncbi:MAG: RNA polymerase sigma factor [Planctomycetes bacterium]|nr:RNA polymerase sigma factor [Planctomycetota bacterium]
MSPADPRSDEALVRAVNAGDASAFESLYLRHRDWVVRLALRFAGNREDALDVLQEAFLYLLRKFPGFRLTARLTTFLYPVVKHLAADRRRAARRTAGEDAIVAEPAAPAAPPAGRDASLGDLTEVLARLPEGQREALLLRYVDGFSLAEIAGALEIPVGTVKSRIHNALETLRQDPRARRYFEP